MGSNRGRFSTNDDIEVAGLMPSFASPMSAAQSQGTDGKRLHTSRITSFGSAFEQSIGFPSENAVELGQNSLFGTKSGGTSNNSDSLQHGNFSKTLASPGVAPSAAAPGLQWSTQQHRQQSHPVLHSGGRFENREESPVAEMSPRTDTSTDLDMEDRNHRFESGQVGLVGGCDSSERSKDKMGDQKTLRRLAQNREAARKSRLRKKAYVQQLENSRLKLTQLEQELQRARQQGIFISSTGDQTHSMNGNGALAFDLEYARWLEEHNKQVNDLRAAINVHAGDSELRIIVDSVLSHYEEIYRIKGVAAKADVFHVLSGMWKTPAERCFLWLGGFRSSEVLKLLVSHLEPLTEQQLVGICNLQQSSQQAEDALSQGMEALQQSLAETLSSGSLGPSGSSANVANYMGQMAMAMGKLETLEGFLSQADNLRQQTMQQMHRILTTRQSARAIVAMNNYFSRLRALSSLWLARPRE